MKHKKIYYFLIIVAIGLFLFAMTVFNETTFLAPIMIVISLYLLIGAMIKLCKTNDKLKNTILCAIDLLFWLP